MRARFSGKALSSCWLSVFCVCFGTWGSVASLQAASCCGGGSSTPLLLPKFYRQMIRNTTSLEVYDGYWNGEGEVREDPPGSKLMQWRTNLGYGRRLAPRWQANVNLPWVWNDNRYGSRESSSQGLGDAKLGIIYEAFDGIQCVNEISSWRDLAPASYLSMTLTLPTGISPFDDEQHSYDITGRGHYLLQLGALIEKTVFPWSLKFGLSGTHAFERSVNQEYGRAISPYRRQLGQRMDANLGFGYVSPTQTWGSLAAEVNFDTFQEGKVKLDGRKDTNSGSERTSISLGLAWSNVPKTRIVNFGYRLSPRNAQWGENFPITETFTAGFSYVIP